MQKHGIEIRYARGEHNPMRREFVLVGDQCDVAQFAHASNFLHFLIAMVGPVGVAELLTIRQNCVRAHVGNKSVHRHLC